MADSARGEEVTPEMIYKVAYEWCEKLGLPLMSPPRAPEAIDQLGREIERLRSARGEDHEAVKDLRGVECREVHRDDAVIIDGAEYLRKSRLARQAEFGPSPVVDTVRLREALTLVQKLIAIPPERILDDTERVRRIGLVVDTALSVDAGKPNDGS